MKRKKQDSYWQWDSNGRALHAPVKTYEPRFIKKEEVEEIVNLYHISRIALSGQNASRYARLQYVVEEFLKKHSKYTSLAVYKDAECLTQL